MSAEMTDDVKPSTKSETRRINEAVHNVKEEYEDPHNIDGKFVYELCKDLGIRYAVSQVMDKAKQELREEKQEKENSKDEYENDYDTHFV
jgi:hypothetical protein